MKEKILIAMLLVPILMFFAVSMFTIIFVFVEITGGKWWYWSPLLVIIIWSSWAFASCLSEEGDLE